MVKNSKSRTATLAAFLSVAIVLFAWVAHFGPTWPNNDSYGYLLYLDLLGSGETKPLQILWARSQEHLIAFHLSFALASLKLFDMRTKALLFENAALLLLAGWLLQLTLRRAEISRVFPILVPLVVALPLLNLSQTSYLLWEFQIWWYLDFAMLAVTILLIERHGFRAYPAVFVLCALGSGCEAQGTFLWLSTGVQMLLLPVPGNSRRLAIKGIFVLLTHTVLFLLVAWLMLGESHRLDPAYAGVQGTLAHKVISHVSYFLKVLGGGFGIKNEPSALVFGTVSIVLWAVLSTRAALRRFASTESRVAFILTSTSILWTLAFAVGREKYGVAWAFSDFHASPMLVPMYIGFSVYALEWIVSGIGGLRRSAAYSIVAFSLLPVVTAVPYGYAESFAMRSRSNLAAAVSCNPGDFPQSVVLHLIGLDNFEQLYLKTRHFNGEMCAIQPDTSAWLEELKATMPPGSH